MGGGYKFGFVLESRAGSMILTGTARFVSLLYLFVCYNVGNLKKRRSPL